jgi:hypothetical protein
MARCATWRGRNLPGPLLIVGRGQVPGFAALQKEDPVARGWKIWTRDENVSPPTEALENTEYDLKEDALKAAWQLTYSPTVDLLIKVLRIEGPDGERIELEEIAAWFKARSGLE